jgi:hypothetical protein
VSQLVGPPDDVAKLLGDTVETIEKHHAPFVRELRERARRIMESGEGLEITGTQRAKQKQPEGKTELNRKKIIAGEPVSRILSAARPSS